MKKTYIQPEMLAVELQHSQIIATSDPVQEVVGPIDNGGAGSGDSDAKESSVNVWDEEW